MMSWVILGYIVLSGGVMCRRLVSSHIFSMLLFVLLLFVLSVTQTQSPACNLQLTKIFVDYEYFRTGDVIIGGVFSVNYFMNRFLVENDNIDICLRPVPLYYKYLLTFLFTIDEINRDQTLLPNVTLGYHIYDSCSYARKAVKSVLQILSGPGKTNPNYSCMERSKLSGFIGDQDSITTASMAQILALYGYTQVSYGATSHVISDQNLYPTFYRTVQGDQVSYLVLSDLIMYFGWSWVGVLSSDDYAGNEEVLLLTQYLTHKGICVAYTIQTKSVPINATDDNNKMRMDIIKKSSAQVIILCGTYSQPFADLLIALRELLREKTLVFGPTFASLLFLFEQQREIFNGSLSLLPTPLPVPDMKMFYESFQIINHPEDKLLEHIFLAHQQCLLRDKISNIIYISIYKRPLYNCSGNENITIFSSLHIRGLTDRVYKAVYSMAQALHNMHIALGEKIPPFYEYRHQLHRYLRKERNKNGDLVFNEHGEFLTPYKIMNWKVLNNTCIIESVGQTFKVSGSRHNFSIQLHKIMWKNGGNEVPKSQCSENCLMGSRKVPMAGKHSCCYSCVLCSEGEISNVTDSENCMKCGDHDWPNEEKTRCAPKVLEFLSYTNDTIAVIILISSILLYLLSFLILIIFILHQDTPLVKANNRNLSFLLLVSIMLSFLSVFLFLGRPVDATCILRQISFGVLFSVAISCVLGKTIMVYIVFRATRPGSLWKSWVGTKPSNCVVLLCSSIQVVICVSWVTISPPFQELDTYSYQGMIIVQCNEGSVAGFYSVLGFMGILAAISFIIAFLARTLPDNFNEAKSITFSMLVFCSVWITMIPAYLSTKGKYMVAVEIFAILSSCAGLLVCIFFPKCYIVLWRPELNTKKHLLQ